MHSFCILGVTNVGKSTLLSSLDKEEFATVEIGKEMRRRYPPEFFKGKAAMSETEDEAFRILTEQLKEANGRPVVIDGQPRMRSQVTRVLDTLTNPHFILLTCYDEELRRRINARDSDEANRELSRQRLINDKVQLYDVLTALIYLKEHVEVFNSMSHTLNTEVKAYMRGIINGR